MKEATLEFHDFARLADGTFSPEALNVYHRIFPERAEAVGALMNMATISLYLSKFAVKIEFVEPKRVTVANASGTFTGTTLIEATVRAMKKDRVYIAYMREIYTGIQYDRERRCPTEQSGIRNRRASP